MPMKKPVNKWMYIRTFAEQVIRRLQNPWVFLALWMGDKKLSEQESYPIHTK